VIVELYQVSLGRGLTKKVDVNVSTEQPGKQWSAEIIVPKMKKNRDKEYSRRRRPGARFGVGLDWEQGRRRVCFGTLGSICLVDSIQVEEREKEEERKVG